MINLKRCPQMPVIWTLLMTILVFKASSLATNPSDVMAWQQVAQQCDNFDNSVQTLELFMKFQISYDKLNECLHLDEPPAICLAAEQSCRQNGLPFSGVKILGQLVRRAAQGEPICHMEFAMKIYRLHKQVVENSASPKLARLLRTLANRWAARCRKSLAKRLLEVELTPDDEPSDAFKHLSMIDNVLNIGDDEIANLQVEPEHYVTILEEERALDEQVSSAGGRGASGFRFNTSKQIDMGLQMVRMSCHALKPYQVNILGSIGLLASIGYAAPFSLNKEDEMVREMVRRWIVSAMLCQMLRGISKMSTVDAEGKDRDEILVLPIQEADVGLQDEGYEEFASFGLPEAINGRMAMDLGGSKKADLYVYNETGKLNSRKMELINGPSRTLAAAFYGYLDLRQTDRMRIVKTFLGLVN